MANSPSQQPHTIYPTPRTLASLLPPALAVLVALALLAALPALSSQAATRVT